jgi:hypothetical protein
MAMGLREQQAHDEAMARKYARKQKQADEAHAAFAEQLGEILDRLKENMHIVAPVTQRLKFSAQPTAIDLNSPRMFEIPPPAERPDTACTIIPQCQPELPGRIYSLTRERINKLNIERMRDGSLVVVIIASDNRE